MVYTIRQQYVVLPRVPEYAVQSLSSSIDVETTDVPGGGGYSMRCGFGYRSQNPKKGINQR